MDLLRSGGELGHAAPVGDRRLVGSQALRGPDRVDRDVAATDHHDPVARRTGVSDSGFQAPIRLTRVRYSLAE